MKTISPVFRRLLASFAVASAATILSLSASSCASCSSECDDRIPEVTEDNFGAYLMVSFREQYHDIFFALSSDGYTFTDVNGNKPVLLGIDLAEQKGIRDPHIFRGPDGFYMAATDLHIYAQRQGLRSTQWQRDGQKYGWGNNRSLVLMKSKDLINWTSTHFDVAAAFPELGDISQAWAPETAYDPVEGKIFVYFTLGLKGGDVKQLYYSYTDKDFTRLVTVPKLLGFDPDLGDHSYIDGDLSYGNGKFHLFDYDSGIKHAESDHLLYGYKYVNDENCAKTGGAVEAPNVWRRIGTDKYVLMFDNYSFPNEMAFSETTDFREFTNLGLFNQGVMKTTNFTGAKHGAVIMLTKDEAEAFAKYCGIENTDSVVQFARIPQPRQRKNMLT